MNGCAKRITEMKCLAACLKSPRSIQFRPETAAIFALAEATSSFTLRVIFDVAEVDAIPR